VTDTITLLQTSHDNSGMAKTNAKLQKRKSKQHKKAEQSSE